MVACPFFGAVAELAGQGRTDLFCQGLDEDMVALRAPSVTSGSSFIQGLDPCRKTRLSRFLLNPPGW